MTEITLTNGNNVRVTDDAISVKSIINQREDAIFISFVLYNTNEIVFINKKMIAYFKNVK